jgi:hypothetical protein
MVDVMIHPKIQYSMRGSFSGFRWWSIGNPVHKMDHGFVWGSDANVASLILVRYLVTLI